jgi:hypothetical protein
VKWGCFAQNLFPCGPGLQYNYYAMDDSWSPSLRRRLGSEMTILIAMNTSNQWLTGRTTARGGNWAPSVSECLGMITEMIREVHKDGFFSLSVHSLQRVLNLRGVSLRFSAFIYYTFYFSLFFYLTTFPIAGLVLRVGRRACADSDEYFFIFTLPTSYI